MSRLFGIGDTHFHHENIITYCRRPFRSAAEMNEVLIENWNKAVDDKDIVLHFGDWLLGTTEQMFENIQRLKGKKYLIKGNHDPQSIMKLEDRLGFERAFKDPLECAGLVLSHEPIRTELVNIHAHQHRRFRNYPPQVFKEGRYCISCENTGYKPILFTEILELLGCSESYSRQVIEEIKRQLLD